MAEKISALDALLKSDINITEDVNIPRLGAQITVKAIDAKVWKSAAADTVSRNGAVDSFDLSVALIVESEVEGIFRDGALMEKVGAMSPEECVTRTLLAGEIVALAQVIQDISGFDASAQIEQAKN